MHLDADSLHFWGRTRVRAILQTEAAECGLACLAMIADYWGHHCDLPGLRRRFSISLKGMSLKTLLTMAASLGLQTRPLKLPLEQITQLRLPAILHWDLNHFVVLQRCNERRAEIANPATGQQTLALPELSRHFSGVAVELAPDANFRRQPKAQTFSVFSLMGRVIGLRRALVQLVVLSLCLQSCGLLAPFYLQWVVDEAITTGESSLVTVLAIGALLLIVLQTSIAAVRSWTSTVLATHLNFQWLGNVFAHLLRLPLDYFEKRHLGDVVSRFGSVQALQRSLTTQFIESLIDGVLVLATLGMMLRASVQLTAITVTAIAVYTGLRASLLHAMRSASAVQIAHAARAQTQLIETIRGVQSVRLFQRADERRASWLNQLAAQFNAELRLARITITQQTCNQLLFGIERIVVVWIAALLVLERHFSVGMLFAFLGYRDQFSQRLAATVDRACEWRLLRLQGERLADIVMQEPECDADIAINTHHRACDIELRDLSFRYADGEPAVINGLSLAIPAGQCIAITGASGCGKTTLAKLLLGLHAPQAGDIYFDERRISQFGLSNYRRLIGSVMQDDPLFAGTIADNICFFDPGPDPHRITACAQIAAIHGVIVAMPMGYNTLVGESGTGLSGGQKQRLLLARALYGQPRILLLDEATSQLDLASERLVNAAIRKLALTRIVIAHRPETIAMADRVVVLDQGRIVRDFTTDAGPDSDPVNKYEQAQPYHVDEMPVPGHCFEGKMALGREVTA
jgi:ATP-binding cassette subfamily B protein RaxB